mgnify:CR=1 FL=1
MHYVPKRLKQRRKTVNQAVDPNTIALIDLAQGKLDPQARRALAQRAVHDPHLAAQMKLAMRLADGGAQVACDWVQVAARAPAPAAHAWWRPLAGVTASLAVVAAVLTMPRTAQIDSTPSESVAQMQQSLPDQIGAGSFEAPELFGGSFETD